MPTSVWKQFTEPEAYRDYLALLSYLPLKRYRTLPRFLGYTRRIQGQLSASHGIVGYSLRAHLLTKAFWTLSVWQDEAALNDFAFSGFHSGVIQVLRDEMGPTKFIRWKLRGTEVPPSWEEAMRRFEETETI